MTNGTYADFLQVLLGEAREDLLVDLVVAECCLVFFEAQAPQPDHDVHDDAPYSGLGRIMVLHREGVYWGTRQPDTSRLGGSPTGGSTEPRSLMLPPHVWVLTNRSLTTSLCDQSAIGGAEMSGKIVQLRQAKNIVMRPVYLGGSSPY
jgi:hypothetical protein